MLMVMMIMMMIINLKTSFLEIKFMKHNLRCLQMVKMDLCKCMQIYAFIKLF